MSERSCLIRHYVFNLPQLLVNAAGLHLGRLSFATALLILIKYHPLSVPHSLYGHNQTDWDEIRETDEPTTPSIEDIGCNAAA